MPAAWVMPPQTQALPIFAHRMKQNPAHPGTPGSSPSPRRCNTAEAPARVTSEVSGLSRNCCCVLPCPRSPFRGAGDAAPGDGGAGGCCPLLPGVQSPAKGSGAHRAASPSQGPAKGLESGRDSLSAPLYSSRGTPRQPDNYTGPSTNHLYITSCGTAT